MMSAWNTLLLFGIFWFWIQSLQRRIHALENELIVPRRMAELQKRLDTPPTGG
jgi:hypothetical protein